jgi:hypothetical protein
MPRKHTAVLLAWGIGERTEKKTMFFCRKYELREND